MLFIFGFSFLLFLGQTLLLGSGFLVFGDTLHLFIFFNTTSLHFSIAIVLLLAELGVLRAPGALSHILFTPHGYLPIVLLFFPSPLIFGLNPLALCGSGFFFDPSLLGWVCATSWSRLTRVRSAVSGRVKWLLATRTMLVVASIGSCCRFTLSTYARIPAVLWRLLLLLLRLRLSLALFLRTALLLHLLATLILFLLADELSDLLAGVAPIVIAISIVAF